MNLTFLPFYIYLMLTIVMGISAIWKGALYAGITGIIGPLLCGFATAGLRGSLIVGTPAQKRQGFVLAIVLAGVGLVLVFHSGYWVHLFGYELSGLAWCGIGIVVGWIAATREWLRNRRSVRV